jgi:hypothetical protein
MGCHDMKQFFKENIAIVAAIALPLILVLAFAVSTTVANKVVADPKYDFLIATNYNGGNEAFYFDVVQNRLKINYAFPVSNKNGGYQNANIARLWRIHVPTMAVEEIPLTSPSRSKDDEGGKRVEIDVPGVTNLHVMNVQPSPDGYVFQENYDYYNSNLMMEMFSSPRNRNGDVRAIVKSGRALPVKDLGGNAYNYYNTRFIGWIVNDQ